jgi:hypothetical protein
MLPPATKVVLAAALSACSNGTAAPAPVTAPTVDTSAPRYDTAGALLPPRDYRTWVFLTSGYGMSYGPAAASGPRLHDNVYVRRASYEHFLATGTWPEETMFVLEIRASESEGSINHGGQFQTDLAGVEAEVKDSRRFASGWGFFSFEADDNGPTQPASVLPSDASCYACHAKSAAVENTFTQFYPTLLPVARAKGTVRADFVGMPATVSEVFQRVAADGWPAGERLLGEVAARWPEAGVLREPALHHLGHRLLQGDKTAEAVAVLEHATQRFAASANAWDSLSEAYEQAGDRQAAQRALAEARRVLPLDISLTPARREAMERGLKEREGRLGAPR